MKLSLARILKNASEIKSVQERVEYLKQNDSGPLRAILVATYNPNIKFLLPKGKAPYKPSEFERLEGRLIAETRKLYLFIEGGGANISQLKREQLFIDILESVDPEDAELLVHVKDKKLPYKNLGKSIIDKSFPGLIPT
jgi:hypothetical protein